MSKLKIRMYIIAAIKKHPRTNRELINFFRGFITDSAIRTATSELEKMCVLSREYIRITDPYGSITSQYKFTYIGSSEL